MSETDNTNTFTQGDDTQTNRSGYSFNQPESREFKPEKYQNLEKINEDTNIDIQMPQIKKKFPMSDKIKLGMNFMRDKKKTAIDELRQ